MFKLSESDYSKVKPLFNNVPINTYFAQAVIDGMAVGRVFVDDLTQPTVAYVIHSYGMSLLVGNYQNQQFNVLLSNFWQTTVREHDEYLQCYPAQWDMVVTKLFPQPVISCDCVDSSNINGRIIQHTRVNLAFNQEKFMALNEQIKFDNYDIRELSADDFFAYNGSVVPNLFWRNSEIFLTNAKAFALYIDGSIASVAFSSCQNSHVLELGIETNPMLRGKGLAKVVCARLINYAIELNLEPVWACREGNIGSLILAQSLGFVVKCKLPYYQFKK